MRSSRGVRYWLGTNGPAAADEKKRILEHGIAAGRAAAAARARRARTDTSGWPPTWARWPMRTACARASSTARRFAKRSRRRRRLDPAFLDGSPDRALGRWYYKVPGLFGGDLEKSEQHLRTALTYKPDSVISLLFLAETLIKRDRKAEARTTLDAAIAAPPDPAWIPEDTRFKARGPPAAVDADALTRQPARALV